MRAILTNPRYTGYQVWAKQRREEVLLDVEDVGAGHQTIMRWNSEEQWVWSTEPSHEALVSTATFDTVHARMASRSGGRGPRTAPKANRHYLLRDRLRCALCGRNLQGGIADGRTWYRCKFGAEYAAAALDHSKSVNLREDHLLPRIDEWLASTFGAAHLDRTCAAIADAAQLGTVVDTSAAEATIGACDTKLARYRAALDAGTDPVIVAGWIKQVRVTGTRPQL